MGTEWGLTCSVQSSFTLAESFIEGSPAAHVLLLEWKDTRKPGCSKDLACRLEWVWRKSKGQRPKPRHACVLFLSHITLPSPSHFHNNSWMFGEATACCLLGCLPWGRGRWGHLGKRVQWSQEECGIWAAAKLRLLLYGNLHLCLWGWGYLRQLNWLSSCTHKGWQGFPPLVCSVSLPTPYHSHPGASNLHWEIRKAHLRRWCETDTGGTTAEVLLPENTGYLWKTHLSLKLCLLELGSGRDGRQFSESLIQLSTQAHKRRICGSEGYLLSSQCLCWLVCTMVISESVHWVSLAAWTCNANRNRQCWVL